MLMQSVYAKVGTNKRRDFAREERHRERSEKRRIKWNFPVTVQKETGSVLRAWSSKIQQKFSNQKCLMNAMCVRMNNLSNRLIPEQQTLKTLPLFFVPLDSVFDRRIGNSIGWVPWTHWKCCCRSRSQVQIH